MELPEITRTLLAAKKTKGLTFADLGAVVDRDEVWVAALCYRQATASPEEAQKLVAALESVLKNGVDNFGGWKLPPDAHSQRI